MNTYDFSLLTQKELEEKLETSVSQGLTSEAVQKRQQQFGPNQIKEKRSSSRMLFLRQFRSPFTYLLTGAALLSFLIADVINALIILLIVIINALLSFYQEYRAEEALKLIQKRLVMKAKVVRNGQEFMIANTELVPGDIILLDPGDYIPADVRIINGIIEVDESALTGESSPTKKEGIPLPEPARNVYEAHNLGFIGTIVTSGTARAIVIETGNNTLFGTISLLSLHTIQESGFQQALWRLSFFILIIICITLAVLFAFHFIMKGNRDTIELLLFCIAIALGITPEALPTITTFALSRGALELARRNVIVKRLSAIEDLGSISILCTDKTGTLTENKLSVSAIKKLDDELVIYALLTAKKANATDSFDKALWAYASEEDQKKESLFTRIAEIPFQPQKRFNGVEVAQDGIRLRILRGAHESIEQLCQPISQDLHTWIEEQSCQGNRILALAYEKLPSSLLAPDDKRMTLAGLIAFKDPIKLTAYGAIQKAHKLGVTLKMITGDSIEVACAVAKATGLIIDHQTAVMSGTRFAQLSAEEKSAAVRNHSVFARIIPEQKYEIVNLLKNYDSSREPQPLIGFLGEGINDAPALKAAHVGLAVQGASDIAQDAADIILVRKSLMVIVDGIALGRNIFANTMKYIITVLSSNFGNFYSLAIASLILDFLPMLPLQILLMNLLSDFPMVAIATDTVDTDEPDKPMIFNVRALAFISILLGLVCPFFDFMFFALFYHFGPTAVQTNWFIFSIFTELALIFSVRTRHPFFKGRRPSTALIFLSIIVAIITVTLPFTGIGQKVFGFQPTDSTKLGIISLLVLSYFITTDIVKVLYFKLSNHSGR